MSLCALELKQTLISLPFEVVRLFKLDEQALRSYLKLTCEHQLHILPNTEVSTAKDHGKNYMKVGPPMVRHLLRNRLFKLSNASWSNKYRVSQKICIESGAHKTSFLDAFKAGFYLSKYVRSK